jgi:hypothetical protein
MLPIATSMACKWTLPPISLIIQQCEQATICEKQSHIDFEGILAGLPALCEFILPDKYTYWACSLRVPWQNSNT